MNLIDLAGLTKGLVSEEDCKTLIEYFESNSSHTYAEQTTNVLTNEVEACTYQALKVDTESPVHPMCVAYFEQALDSWLNYLHQYNMFSTQMLLAMCREIKSYRILKYEEGSYIPPHVDVGTGHLRQKLIRGSCTLNLSSHTEYEGGDFVFFNGAHTVALDRGDSLIFPADPCWVHSVSKVTKGCRYAVNAFLIPETPMNPQNGKGDRYRKVDDKKYRDNWDKIFKDEKAKEEDVKDLPPDLESFGQEKI